MQGSYHSIYRGMRVVGVGAEKSISQNNNIGVYPLGMSGIVKADCPKIFHAHIKRILNMCWSPFDFNLLASCSIDGTTKIWSIPENFDKDIKEPNAVLNCEKKVCTIKFHPTCPQILASGGVAKKLRLWDVEKGEAFTTIPMKDAPLAMDFNTSGNTLFCCGRDKKLRMMDIRAEDAVKAELPCFGSVKGINVIYMKDKDHVVCSGFERDGRRGIKMFDPRDLSKEVQKLMVRDQSTGILVSMYDQDLGILYVAGRGESNITYYDHDTGIFREIGSHKEREPHLGIELVPKVALNTMKHEIGRFYKFTPKKEILPLRIIFPKMSKDFQADLFPDTYGFKPTATLEEFKSGAELSPVEKVSLEPGKRDESTLFWSQDRDEK